MPTKTEKARMKDFLVDRIVSADFGVKPVSKEICGEKVDYLNVDNGTSKKMILLVGDKYSEERFKPFYEKARGQFGENFGTVFYKDGKTFFRSYALTVRVTEKRQRSLRNYDEAEIRRMILLTPEEITASHRGFVQYYQPESERLSEGLRTFKFVPVNYDYGYLPSDDGRKIPAEKDSPRLFLWDSDFFCDGFLGIYSGLVNGKAILRKDFGNRMREIPLDLESATEEKIRAIEEMFGYRGLKGFGAFELMDLSDPTTRRAVGHVFERLVEKANHK